MEAGPWVLRRRAGREAGWRVCRGGALSGRRGAGRVMRERCTNWDQTEPRLSASGEESVQRLPLLTTPLGAAHARRSLRGQAAVGHVRTLAIIVSARLYPSVARGPAASPTMPSLCNAYKRPTKWVTLCHGFIDRATSEFATGAVRKPAF